MEPVFFVAECRAGAIGVERLQSWRVSHRARAEPCRYLVRGTSTSVGSVKRELPYLTLTLSLPSDGPERE
jgi:hypothetical protein